MSSSSRASEVAATSSSDTVASSVTRFGIELVAWVAGPWAAAEAVGSWWPAPIALLILIGMPALFNTPGDKKTTGISTPGPIRIVVEMVLLVTAVVAAWTVWPVWAGVLVTVLGIALLVTGLSRYRWLAEGAPPPPAPHQ